LLLFATNCRTIESNNPIFKKLKGNTMATSVRLDDGFVNHARVYAEAESRSLPKQIEYWAKIGQMMVDNPDLSYQFVHETLLASEEVKQGLSKRYVRTTKRD